MQDVIKNSGVRVPLRAKIERLGASDLRAA